MDFFNGLCGLLQHIAWTSDSGILTEDKENVNTGVQTAFGLYALGGVLGFAGVALTGKRARKED